MSAPGKRAMFVDLTGDDSPPPKSSRPSFGAASAPIDLDSDDELPFSTHGGGGGGGGATASIHGAAGSSASTHSAAAGWLRPLSEVTCPICMCETAPEEGVVLSGCEHAFCEDCIVTYVTGKVTEGQVMPEQLRCPSVDPKCGESLSPADVARCLKEPEAVARYERLALQRCVEADEGMGCCPTAGCEFMFAFDMDNRKLECPLCNKSFCLVCRTEPWHTGVRCEAWRGAV